MQIFSQDIRGVAGLGSFVPISNYLLEMHKI